MYAFWILYTSCCIQKYELAERDSGGMFPPPSALHTHHQENLSWDRVDRALDLLRRKNTTHHDFTSCSSTCSCSDAPTSLLRGVHDSCGVGIGRNAGAAEESLRRGD